MFEQTVNNHNISKALVVGNHNIPVPVIEFVTIVYFQTPVRNNPHILSPPKTRKKMKETEIFVEKAIKKPDDQANRGKDHGRKDKIDPHEYRNDRQG